MAAAPADFRAAERRATAKIAREAGGGLELDLEPTEDILAGAGRRTPRRTRPSSASRPRRGRRRSPRPREARAQGRSTRSSSTTSRARRSASTRADNEVTIVERGRRAPRPARVEERRSPTRSSTASRRCERRRSASRALTAFLHSDGGRQRRHSTRSTDAGVELLEDGSFDEATVPLAEAARRAPEKSSVREALGRAYFRNRQFAEAAAEFEAVVETPPGQRLRALLPRPGAEPDRRARARPPSPRAGLEPAPRPQRLPALPRAAAPRS